MSRGTLIVIEGLDRAGKSTQCASLLRSLEEEGHRARYIRFPDRTTSIGKLIDDYLRGQTQMDDHAIHLLFSANRWELAAQIQNDISNGITVIIDRYSYSGAVYSAAKGNQSLPLEWAWQPEMGLPRPDIWFFLNISPEDAMTRGGYGAERYENANMQSKVAKLFQSLAGMRNNEEMCEINAGRTENEVAQDIQSRVLRCIGRMEIGRPLRTLGPLSFTGSDTGSKEI